MAQPKLKKQKGKLKPHIRSHVTGRGRFSPSKHLSFVDRLVDQAKRLERELKNEGRAAREV